MIDKCLGHANENIRTKSLNYLLIFFNISENFDEETIETILSYLDSKSLKSQTTAISLLASLMRVFGPRKFVPIKFKKQVETLMNHPKPNVK